MVIYYTSNCGCIIYVMDIELIINYFKPKNYQKTRSNHPAINYLLISLKDYSNSSAVEYFVCCKLLALEIYSLNVDLICNVVCLFMEILRHDCLNAEFLMSSILYGTFFIYECESIFSIFSSSGFHCAKKPLTHLHLNTYNLFLSLLIKT